MGGGCGFCWAKLQMFSLLSLSSPCVTLSLYHVTSGVSLYFRHVSVRICKKRIWGVRDFRGPNLCSLPHPPSGPIHPRGAPLRGSRDRPGEYYSAAIMWLTSISSRFLIDKVLILAKQKRTPVYTGALLNFKDFTTFPVEQS